MMVRLSVLPIKQSLRYAFFVLCAGWLIASLSLIYQYIIFSSVETQSRGGTIVQGIVGKTSYLPYLQSVGIGFAYDTLLFESCMKQERTGNIYTLVRQLCTVSTTDTKVYTVRVQTGTVWSDGIPLTAEDVFFTYNDVIKNNKRKLSSIEHYKDIIVSLLPDNTIKVTFPLESVDNGLLFTLPILPEHILGDKTLEYYTNNFGNNPITAGCASIVPQNKDKSSLVFDMTKCNVPMSFYQIKNFESKEIMEEYIKTSQTNIIDFSYGLPGMSGYVAYPVVTNSYLGLFFNTKSPKLSPGLRRSIASLIQHHLIPGTGALPFLLKDTYIFPRLSGTGQDIRVQLNQLGSPNTTTVNQQTLQNINVPKLPSELFIQGRNKSSVYYIETTSIPNNLQLRFESTYDRMTITSSDGKETDIKLIDKIKRIGFFDVSKDPSLKEGLNKYIIRGYRNNKPRILLRLDIYLLKKEEQSSQSNITGAGPIDPTKQLSLIALNIPDHVQTIEEIKRIFVSQGLGDYLTVIIYDKQSEFEGKLLSKDYDMALRTLDRGLKKDASSLFMTDQSIINPSLYTNTQLASYIKQYLNSSTEATRTTIKREIDDLYINAMPLLLLGRMTSPVIIRASYNTQRSGLINEGDLMSQIIERVHIQRASMRVDRAKVLSWKNFLAFVTMLRQPATTPTP